MQIGFQILNDTLLFRKLRNLFGKFENKRTLLSMSMSNVKCFANCHDGF